MSMVCRIRGHRFSNTIDIVRKENFFDINDAKYCDRCGAICVCTQHQVVR